MPYGIELRRRFQRNPHPHGLSGSGVGGATGGPMRILQVAILSSPKGNRSQVRSKDSILLLTNWPTWCNRLPVRFRAHRWVVPAYGLATQAMFRTGAADASAEWVISNAGGPVAVDGSTGVADLPMSSANSVSLKAIQRDDDSGW